MKRIIFFVITVVLLFSTVTTADLSAPSDLNPGGTFRWIFQTSLTTQATNSNTAYYDNFVNNAADNATAPNVHNVMGITKVGQIAWQAIVSTVNDGSARTHIGAFTSPVYNTNQQLVATGDTGLFSGSLNAYVWFDESGQSTVPNTYTWTGTNSDGSTYYFPWGSAALGRMNAVYGRSDHLDGAR